MVAKVVFHLLKRKLIIKIKMIKPNHGTSGLEEEAMAVVVAEEEVAEEEEATMKLLALNLIPPTLANTCPRILGSS
jgi:hypothetical protein